jgi:hypothetical protein
VRAEGGADGRHPASFINLEEHMHNDLKRYIGAAALTVLAAFPARAATLVSVPDVPGSVSGSTGPLGINKDGTIAGSYFTNDGIEHSFFGSIGATYTTFDATTNPSLAGTEARGIADDGTITGFYNSVNAQAPYQLYEFERLPNGAIVNITKGGQQLFGIPQGLANPKDIFAGDYFTFAPAIQRHSYLGRSGAWQTDVVPPFQSVASEARGTNASGTVVGIFIDPNGNPHGYVVDQGSATQIDYPDPGSTGTFLEGVNDPHTATGNWFDANGNSHAFTYDINKHAFTPISVPGATGVSAWGINQFGLVVLQSDVGSYVYCPKGGGQCPGGHQIKVADPEPVEVLPNRQHTIICMNGCKKALEHAHDGKATQQAIDRAYTLVRQSQYAPVQ